MLKRFYSGLCRLEMWLASALLMAIASLVFVSAIARTVRSPLNWAVDTSMLLFAWLVFIGGDIVVRETGLISVDMFQKLLPPLWSRILRIAFLLMMMAFLAVLIRYGVPLLIENRKRMFQTMELSYSWCTLAVPVGSLLMLVSCAVRLFGLIRGQADGERGK